MARDVYAVPGHSFPKRVRPGTARQFGCAVPGPTSFGKRARQAVPNWAGPFHFHSFSPESLLTPKAAGEAMPNWGRKWFDLGVGGAGFDFVEGFWVLVARRRRLEGFDLGVGFAGFGLGFGCGKGGFADYCFGGGVAPLLGILRWEEIAAMEIMDGDLEMNE
ncbi:hypothetical protein Dsin_017262 [Dipteronia sinensis]|uniref:Uncharacterized protein n=1 Tax=Dipteronia sinensis TaxID=43782 RepID=A0AAE0E693_9ROSI|nr:hypothetical protein Dsin_017262 [Dipteronia sinensis]